MQGQVSVSRAVEEEGGVELVVRAVPQRGEERLRELEVCWELSLQLPRAVQEQQEHWRAGRLLSRQQT